MYVPLFFFGKEREEIIDMSDMSHVYSVILSQDSISIHHLKVDLRLSTNLVTKILRHFWETRSVCPAFQVRSGDVLLLSELTVAALEALAGTRIWLCP